MMNVGGLTDFGAGVSREFEDLEKSIISLKYGVVKRVLRDKLFCKNFNVSDLGGSISIHCFDYPARIEIFPNSVSLDILGNVEYHNDYHIFLTLDEFIEDNIKEKCAEKYQSLEINSYYSMKPGENYYLMSYNDKIYKRTTYEFIKHIGWEIYNGECWIDCNFVEHDELEKQYQRIKKLERICK